MHQRERANVWNPALGNPMYGAAALPLPDSAFRDFTLEPQFVRVRAANRAFLYADSNDVSSAGYSTTDCVVGTPGDGTMMRNVKRIGMKGFQFSFATPVINNSNNSLYVFSTATNVITLVTIPVGDWNTPQLLATAFLRGVANAGGIPGTAFTWTFRNRDPSTIWPVDYPVPTTDNQAVLSANPAVVFLAQSTAIARGTSTYGWPNVRTPTYDGSPLTAPQIAAFAAVSWTTINMSMPCLYTRYIDVFSTTLTSWSKLATASTSAGANALIYRYFFVPFSGYQQVPPTQIVVAAVGSSPILYQYSVDRHFSVETEPIMWTFNQDESITTMDFRFRDEYDRELVTVPEYVHRESIVGLPSSTVAVIDPIKKNGGFDWLIVLTCEL